MHTHLQERVFYSLTVKYWPKAAEQGVRPIECRGFSDDQGHYSPTVIEFGNPPSRADFLQIVRQTPWMHVWEDALVPVIAANDWPMLDYAHKRSTVDLLDDQGRVCGELTVQKERFYQNQSVAVPMITCDVRDKVTCRLRTDKSDTDIHLLLTRAENRIQERMVNAGDLSDERMEYEIRLVLHDAGLLKTKPKEPVLTPA